MSHSPPLRRRLYLMRHGEVWYFDAEGAPLDPRRARLTAADVEQDMSCLNITESDGPGSAVERRRIKALNITPYNLAKHGLNLTSLEQMYRAYRPQAKTRS